MQEQNKRGSGVLMHISSLPGKFDIGTFGKEAYRFVRLLKWAGQKYWQILPLCPTGFGDSPYQGFSTFAGNPYFIDLDILIEEGYLKKEDLKGYFQNASPQKVDYGRVYTQRREIFQKVQGYFKNNIPADFEAFCLKNAFWLDNYALFMAVKDSLGGRELTLWDEDIKTRLPEAVERYTQKNIDRIQYYKMQQYFFFKQWNALKEYANKNGILIIGDLPIYVSADSADVYSCPEQFELCENLIPKCVAGCPPDAFSEEGQLWGNPIYNWEYMKNDGYSWWIQRLKAAFELYDVVRIDHFRGFAGYYTIAYGAQNAKEGHWNEGPKMGLFDAVRDSLGALPIIAEDLGLLTQDVYKLLEDSTFPGMKVLQFAFDPSGESLYLPKNHIKNCVVYTGTHDNDTLVGYTQNARAEEISFAMKTLNVKNKKELPGAMMKAALCSIADTAILCMQDLIGKGSEARMNTPALSGGNWQWRAVKGEICKRNFRFIKRYTKKTDRK